MNIVALFRSGSDLPACPSSFSVIGRTNCRTVKAAAAVQRFSARTQYAHAWCVTEAHNYRYLVRLPSGAALQVKDDKRQMVIYETESLASAIAAAFNVGGTVVDRHDWRKYA